METVSAFSGIRRLIIALIAVPYFDHLMLGWKGFMPHSKLIQIFLKIVSSPYW
jgi:hypothetical protein